MNFIIFFYKRHLFHLVKKSPWPFLVSCGAFFLTSGLVFVMHRIEMGLFIFFIGIFLVMYIARQWFFNVEDEATLFGYHTKL